MRHNAQADCTMSGTLPHPHTDRMVIRVVLGRRTVTWRKAYSTRQTTQSTHCRKPKGLKATQHCSMQPSIVAWQGHARSRSVPHTAESTCDMCVGGVPLNPSQPLWRQHGCCGRKSGALLATIRNNKPSLRLSTAGTANTLKRRRKSHCA